MEEEVTGSSARLGKKADKTGGGEVDYNAKSGTAWSHSYLNQKPWHPLSYPNQRRKWIAEQTHANRLHRQEEVAREFAQEQEFFRQTALFSKKEKEKMEMLKAVSFMYVRPPGYNAESAKAAELADDKNSSDPAAPNSSQMPEKGVDKNQRNMEKKARPKDVFGRALPTEQEFEVLKNAPRLDTGVAVRSKPFGVEIRNVRCIRCGTYGHQSGDRECPLKDAIMPNDETRLQRDDPLNAIISQTHDPSEPLKWELKQKPGMSPPRGGFDPDDPNQQIVPDDIFDEYGGFLSGGGEIPALLSNFSPDDNKEKKKKEKRNKSKKKEHHSSKSKSRHDRHDSSSDSEPDPHEEEGKSNKRSGPQSSKHKKEYSSDSDTHTEIRRKSSRSKGKHRKKTKKEDDGSEYSSSPSYSSESEDKGRERSRNRRRYLESESRKKGHLGSEETRERDTDRHHPTGYNDSDSSDSSRHRRCRRHSRRHLHHRHHRRKD